MSFFKKGKNKDRNDYKSYSATAAGLSQRASTNAQGLTCRVPVTGQQLCKARAAVLSDLRGGLRLWEAKKLICPSLN